jgi:hypothetical protein
MWYEQSQEENELFSIHQTENYTELGFVYEFQDTFTNVSEKWMKKLTGPPEDKGVKQENKDGYILCTVETPFWTKHLFSDFVVKKIITTKHNKLELEEENLSYKSIFIYKRKQVLKNTEGKCNMKLRVRIVPSKIIPYVLLKKMYMLILNGFLKKAKELDIV